MKVIWYAIVIDEYMKCAKASIIRPLRRIVLFVGLFMEIDQVCGWKLRIQNNFWRLILLVFLLILEVLRQASGVNVRKLISY